MLLRHICIYSCALKKRCLFKISIRELMKAKTIQSIKSRKLHLPNRMVKRWCFIIRTFPKDCPRSGRFSRFRVTGNACPEKLGSLDETRPEILYFVEGSNRDAFDVLLASTFLGLFTRHQKFIQWKKNPSKVFQSESRRVCSTKDFSSLGNPPQAIFRIATWCFLVTRGRTLVLMSWREWLELFCFIIFIILVYYLRGWVGYSFFLFLSSSFHISWEELGLLTPTSNDSRNLWLKYF